MGGGGTAGRRQWAGPAHSGGGSGRGRHSRAAAEAGAEGLMLHGGYQMKTTPGTDRETQFIDGDWQQPNPTKITNSVSKQGPAHEKAKRSQINLAAAQLDP